MGCHQVTSPKKVPGKVNISNYLSLVERVAKAEYRRIPSHMVDFEELVSIGAIAIQTLLKNKTQEEIDNLNTSYLATATRWAIRNELRSRYKWYTLKHNKSSDDVDEEDGDASKAKNRKKGKSATANPGGTENLREAIYETILSIEGIQDGADGDSSYDFISDGSATPEESLEIVELGRAIKRGIESLPEKERRIMEYRFYRNMQVKDIATLVGLSSSRITRIVQASLNQVREYLKDTKHLE
ncbi:MAG: sigma-70 family RNA polymerase sigma factor [Cyanobacteria bacterium P01_H01_bin.74]